MSGFDGDELMLLAAEYALGSLDLDLMREAEAIAARDPTFANEITTWQGRLSPLTSLTAPVRPPPQLWSRLALATGTGAERRGSGSRFWQATTAFSLAVAASLALFAFLPRPPANMVEPTRFAAALSPLASPARFLAETRADGSITVTSLDGTSAPAGRDYELWSLSPGTTVPVPLGVLPPGSRVIMPPQRASAQMQLLVSDEPAGGSPTGAPTGAVVFGGTLTPLSQAAKPGP